MRARRAGSGAETRHADADEAEEGSRTTSTSLWNLVVTMPVTATEDDRGRSRRRGTHEHDDLHGMVVFTEIFEAAVEFADETASFFGWAAGVGFEGLAAHRRGGGTPETKNVAASTYMAISRCHLIRGPRLRDETDERGDGRQAALVMELARRS